MMMRSIRAALALAIRVWLLHDADDAFHAELGVLTAVLGVHEAGQHPVAGPVMDDPLLVCAVVRTLSKE